MASLRRLISAQPVIAVCLGLFALAAAGLEPATQVAGVAPTTAPAFVDGLVCEIYALPTRPKRVRDVLPGLAPKAVHVAPSPSISRADDLEGIIGNVQAVFEGEIHVPMAGDYAFNATSDDGMDLYINHEFVLADAWVNGSKPDKSVTHQLPEGWLPVRVRFYQGDGGYGLTVRWKPPGGDRLVPIPAESFRVAADHVQQANAKLNASATTRPGEEYLAIFKTRGFFELPEDEGDLMVNLLQGPTNLSSASRRDMVGLIKEVNYAGLPAWHQVMVLSGYLRGWHIEQTSRGAATRRADYSVAEAKATDYEGWHGARRTGFRHQITIGDHTITLFTPAADSLERDSVPKAVAGLPAALRQLIRTVTVEPYGTSSEFNSGGGQVWVRLQRPANLPALDNALAHEIGHLLMNRTDCYLQWQDALGKDILSVSHYGRLNPSEDFAEFMRLYLSTNNDSASIDNLAQMFPHRMDVMLACLKKVDFAW